MRNLLLTGLALCAAASASPAQTADPTLYTRVEDGTLRAAIHLDIEPGAHLYHGPTKADLGHPNAVGKPTTVELSGAGVSWSAVRFPEPFPYPQDEFGPGTFINSHEGEVVLYAAGALADGALGDDVVAKLDGLVCDDVGCMPWYHEVESEGAGPDDVWDDWPADLEAPAPAAQDEPEADEPAFLPRRDEHVSGEADATLYTRLDPADPTRVRAAIEIDLTDGWHLYHSEKGNELGIGVPTTVTLAGEGIVWGPVRWPAPEEIDQGDIIEGAWIWGHHEDLVLFAEGTLEAGATWRGAYATLEGQTCEAQCIGYKETAYTQGAGPDSVWAAWSDRDRAGESGRPALELTLGDDAPAEEETPLALFLLEAVMWGLITLLMPCTYPMIPITISFFTKQADARGGNVLPLSLAYGAGIVLIFALIGVVVGPAIVPFAQGGLLNLVIGLLFFYFALVLLGYVDLQPPRFLMNAAGKASTKGGLLGVFLMGACLVVTSFTCTAPFVGTLLARGATGGDLTRVVLGMGVFGLTMAIPFVALSLVPGKIQALPRSGSWMNTLKVTLGFVEIAAAFKFLSNADLAWGWLVISREVFLGLWALIFLVTGLYLFGVVKVKGVEEPVGAKRGAAAMLFTLFAVYCGYGLVGNKLDIVMDTMAPPYSGGRLHAPLYDFGGDWVVVVDDLDQAVETAKAQKKLVLVNFTGHT